MMKMLLGNTAVEVLEVSGALSRVTTDPESFPRYLNVK